MGRVSEKRRFPALQEISSVRNSLLRPALAAAVLGLNALSAAAGGFQITEQSVLGAGRAYAGIGVDGSDVAGQYYNPAVMTLHPGVQLQQSVMLIGLNLDYAGDSGASENGREKTNVVPSFYISAQFNDVVWAGFSVAVPYGLSTSYGSEWEQKEEGTLSKLTVVDFNPSVAFKISDKLSIGGGASVQYIKARLGFNLSDVPVAQLNGGNLGNVHVKLDSVAMGFNVGAMWSPAESVRIGLSYRSAVRHSASGSAAAEPTAVIPSLGAVLLGKQSMDARVDMDAPAWAMLAAAWDVTERLSLYAAYRWTDWSSLQALTVRTPSQSQSVPTKWKDAHLFSLGYDFRVTPFWTFRSGLGYEESPVADSRYRVGTIPDADRWWFALGSSFRFSENFQADISFAHLHGVHNRDLYRQTASGSSRIGKFRRLDGFLGGVQVQYRF
jgi:long-chain fatty acid transport protein